MEKVEKDLVDIIEEIVFENHTICDDCKYKNSFLCDKRYLVGIKETYFDQYNIKLYVYKSRSRDKRKIIDFIHQKELEHHRKGCYFALQCTNFHCGESCECDCDKTRCWFFDKVPSRKQPHCLHFFNIHVPDEYKEDNICFVLSNLEFNYGGK